MPVQPESLEVLEKADVPPAQARAIVRAIEIEIVGAKDTLATKHDILLLRQETAGLLAKLEGRIVELGATLRSEITDSHATLRSETADSHATLRSEMAESHATLRSEMADSHAKLRAEIHSSASSITRQMYTALLGQMAVLLGFAYFFATNIA